MARRRKDIGETHARTRTLVRQLFFVLVRYFARHSRLLSTVSVTTLIASTASPPPRHAAPAGIPIAKQSFRLLANELRLLREIGRIVYYSKAACDVSRIVTLTN